MHEEQTREEMLHNVSVHEFLKLLQSVHNETHKCICSYAWMGLAS